MQTEKNTMTSNAVDQGGFVTAEDVGVHLSIQPNTVRSWARRGKIPSIKLSQKVVRFRLEDVLASLGVVPSPENTESDQ